MGLLRDATMIAALLALTGGGVAYFWQRFKERQLVRHALFAELRHVRQHYGYAKGELPYGQTLATARQYLR